MKKVFICAPNRYKEKSRSLADRLKKAGFSAKFAAEATKQEAGKRDIYESNMALIDESDIFIAYFVEDGHYGIDFAVEVGKVSGRGRRVIGFAELDKNSVDNFKKNLNKDVMFEHSIDSFAWSFEELLELIK